MVGILQWWYGAGLHGRLHRAWLGVLRTADGFSVGLLLRTLANPFRQIAAGSVQGPLPVQFRAALDRLFSRIIGLIVRSVTVVIGLAVIVVRLAWEAMVTLLWVVAPWGPVIGAGLWLAGVGA